LDGDIQVALHTDHRHAGSQLGAGTLCWKSFHYKIFPKKRNGKNYAVTNEILLSSDQSPGLNIHHIMALILRRIQQKCQSRYLLIQDAQQQS
jgi:hypothetical protein